MKRDKALLTIPAILLVLGAFATTTVYGSGGQDKRAAKPKEKQLVTVTNVTSKRLNNIQVQFSGKDAKDFSQKNNCGRELNVGRSCTIQVSFDPKTPGAKSATLEVLSSGGAQSVALTGTGI